jgi:predicted DNA-binding protein with PD1-like motif
VDFFRDGDVLFMRFSDGDDLAEGMKQALKSQGVRSGLVLCGVGMLKSPQLTFYTGGGVYRPIALDEEVELTALNGNVATVDGEVFVHLHATVGKKNGEAMAGHFAGGKVHMTAEVAVRVLTRPMIRVLDERTGLKTLRFE